MQHDTPVAMPVLGRYPPELNQFTLGDYFKQIVKTSDVKDEQVGGTHYRRNSIQPWDIYLEYGLDPWTANVVKYILRFPLKNGKEDLAKAKHYIEYLINNYEDIHGTYYKTKD